MRNLFLALSLVVAAGFSSNAFARCTEGAVVTQPHGSHQQDVRQVCRNGVWTPPGAPSFNKCKEGSKTFFYEKVGGETNASAHLHTCRNGSYYPEGNAYPAHRKCAEGSKTWDRQMNGGNHLEDVLLTCRNGKWRK